MKSGLLSGVLNYFPLATLQSNNLRRCVPRGSFCMLPVEDKYVRYLGARFLLL